MCGLVPDKRLDDDNETVDGDDCKDIHHLQSEQVGEPRQWAEHFHEDR